MKKKLTGPLAGILAAVMLAGCGGPAAATADSPGTADQGAKQASSQAPGSGSQSGEGTAPGAEDGEIPQGAQIGNMGADQVQIYDIGTRFMIDSGWIVPMQELIDADGWDKSQVEPNIAAYYTVGDSLYSMPFNSSHASSLL